MICKGDRICINEHIYVVVSGINVKKGFIIAYVYDDLPFGEPSYSITLSFKEYNTLRKTRDMQTVYKAFKPYINFDK